MPMTPAPRAHVLDKPQLALLAANIQRIDYEIHATLRWVTADGSLDKAQYGALVAASQQRSAHMSRLLRHIQVKEADG